MRKVTRSALDHSTGGIEIDPQKEPEIGSFEVVVYVFAR